MEDYSDSEIIVHRAPVENLFKVYIVWDAYEDPLPANLPLADAIACADWLGDKLSIKPENMTVRTEYLVGQVKNTLKSPKKLGRE